MPQARLDLIADELLQREKDRRSGPRVTDLWGDLTLAQAYDVQGLLLRHKEASDDPLVGVKLGLTSKPKQQRMGIDSPLIAWLTSSMTIDDDFVNLDRLIHPRIEPEIAFVMGDVLAGTNVGPAEAMAAVASVHAAFEVIDSRFDNFDFTLSDVIADNASSARFVLSNLGIDPSQLDLAEEPCTLSVDDVPVDSATGAAVLGHPGIALAFAARDLAARGLTIQPGWIILTGGLTDAVPMEPGHTYAADFDTLGQVSVKAN